MDLFLWKLEVKFLDPERVKTIISYGEDKDVWVPDSQDVGFVQLDESKGMLCKSLIYMFSQSNIEYFREYQSQ